MSFDQYVFNQGIVLKGKQVDSDVIKEYKNVLPAKILELWEEFGFSGLSDGMFWLTNPKDYKYFHNDWKKVNDILSLDDQTEYLVARSAFGDLLFYVSQSDGKSYFSMLDIHYNEYEIFGSKNLDFFFEKVLDDETFAEDYLAEPLFRKCLEKLGPLGAEECYGFSPIPALGGDKSIDYANKVNLREYLSICAQAQA